MPCYDTSEVACPYFYPVERRTPDTDPRSAMLPLGGAWTGLCRAGDAPAQPEPQCLGALCSLGYARGVCPRFPVNDAGPDAVRFAIIREKAHSLQLYYVLERNHHPFAHGPLEYSLPSGALAGASLAETLQRQAQAYIASYLRRKKEASIR
jgi:hypothetical protein